MKADVEELLREGMERFTAEVSAPVGLARAASRLHRRRLATRAAAVACGAAAVAAAAALIVVTGGAAGTAARTGPGPAQARTAAYVTRRVENALARENLVFVGRSGGIAGPSVTWAYGQQSRFEEFWPPTDYRDRVVNGQRRWDFPLQLRGQPYLAQGTALVGGKLTFAYVTYFDHRYSLAALASTRANPCSATSRLAMGGPPIASSQTSDWPDFIRATLDCGIATVTGHVRIDGQETTKIAGKPVMVRLSKGYGQVIGERWVRVRWVLYVNPTTYLPVRIYGSTQAAGGQADSTLSTSVTDVQWLPPVPANIAKTLVAIPPGFHRFFGLPGNQ
jgi:hypothetical protein